MRQSIPSSVAGGVKMSGPLAGVRVLELASHIFVPIGGGILTTPGTVAGVT